MKTQRRLARNRHFAGRARKFATWSRMLRPACQCRWHLWKVRDLRIDQSRKDRETNARIETKVVKTLSECYGPIGEQSGAACKTSPPPRLPSLTEHHTSRHKTARQNTQDPIGSWMCRDLRLVSPQASRSSSRNARFSPALPWHSNNPMSNALSRASARLFCPDVANHPLSNTHTRAFSSALPWHYGQNHLLRRC